MDKVTGEWRRIISKYYDLYSSPKSRGIRCVGPVAHVGNERNSCRVLVGRSKCKRLLGRHMNRWVDNIKKDLQEVGLVSHGVD